MFFWWICGGESGLPVLFLRHLRTTSKTFLLDLRVSEGAKVWFSWTWKPPNPELPSSGGRGLRDLVSGAVDSTLGSGSGSGEQKRDRHPVGIARVTNKEEKEGQRAEKICFSFSCLVRKCDFYFTVHNSHIKYMTKNSEIHTWNCAKNIVSFSISTISFCVSLFSYNIGYRLYKRTFNLVKQFFKNLIFHLFSIF